MTHSSVGRGERVELGSRVVLRVQDTNDLRRLLGGRDLTIARTVSPDIFILQAPDALTATREAHRLAALPEVQVSYPVLSRSADRDGCYAPLPSDFFFDNVLCCNERAQWYLENRNPDGTSAGPDLNTRAAWCKTLGDGVTIAIADGGVELTHPELASRAAPTLHYDFDNLETNGLPYRRDSAGAHGTEVAGLAVAQKDNARMVGVAPEARFASWVIFRTNGLLVSDERLMDMYQYASNVVAVQNHSWGSGLGKAQGGPTLLEEVGINNATAVGRNGLGTVMVRSAGNDRSQLARADDDGYVNDPNVIAVAAVSRSGRVTDYSEPGACLLVSAPGGEFGDGVFTTDLLGTDGGNPINFFPPFDDMNGYVWASWGFTGTSASAPQVTGLAALILSANPKLGYRDVQQILVLSSRQFDFADPDLKTNGAGLLLSHNAGFGVPDAGHAVWLAKSWPNRPPLTTVTMTTTSPADIPDGGLQLAVSGAGVPPELGSIYCLPADAGLHADSPTPALPLVDVGLASSVPSVSLTNKGALILRGSATFDTVIANAAKAGAAFAVIYNSTNGGVYNLGLLVGTDYVPIPAVFVGNTTGQNLKSLFQTNAAARVQIQLNSTNLFYDIQSTLVCEQVGVRLRIEHPVRGDLRITLVSPQGTRSVLAQLNDDTNPASSEWTYWSTHHFLESSAGRWTLCVSDEAQGATGTILSASLILRGVQIIDADHDGLDDVWEQAHLGHTGFGPKDDPDGDGFSNAREQVMGTNPGQVDLPFRVDLVSSTLWGANLARLSWPSVPGVNYAISSATNLSQPMKLLTNVPGRIWETDFYGGSTERPESYFLVAPQPTP
jgi:subtilisin-like proprotein convertase family protein/subtilisin family serine protease